MFLGYSLKVFMVSLAIYGLWCLALDIRQWWLQWPDNSLSVGVIVLLRDCEQSVEEALYDLAHWVENTTVETDVILADCGSDDLTPLIAERVARQYAALTFVDARHMQNPANELMALCRGQVVVVVDTVNRIRVTQLVPAVRAGMKALG